jgi:hypothetical protein
MGRSISTDTSKQQTITHLPTRLRAPSSTTILPPPILTRILALLHVKIISFFLAQKTLTLDFIVRAAKETRIRASDRYFATAGSAGTESVALGRAAVEGAAAAEELWVVDSAHCW